MDKLRYDGPAPPAKMKRIDIIRIRETTPQTFTILSDRPYSIIYHWIKGRSQQCTRSRGDCEGCLTGCEEKWAAYLHAQQWGQDGEIFLELTDACIAKIHALANNRATLRGTIIKLSKTKGGIRGRYVVDMLDRTMPPDDLPNVRFPDELLLKLWAAKRST